MAEQNVKLTKLASCGGCGAKVGAGVLAQLLEDLKVHYDPNLLVGFDKSDDASVYKVTDDLALVQTVDFFPPMVDNPRLFGQVAATNALSDVYAMGGEPKLALNLLCIPEDMPKDAVHEILRGGYEKCYEAGAIITGGHSIHDQEPKYGLSVTGFVHPEKLLTNSNAKPGDVLLLTKPIGIGVLTTAAKAELASEEGMELAYKMMTTLNKSARDAVHEILRGGYEKCYEAGAIITGGHSIHDQEPKYGLSVTGFVHPEKLLTNSNAKPGDVLLLTKPIGIGVLTTAAKAELASEEGMELAYKMMTTLNKSARDAMVKYDVHSCTDVTGFGLMGHSYEMAQGSDVEITLHVDAIDLIPEALEFARMGILPAGMYRNRRFAQHAVDAGDVELAKQDMLYDPQTAGGLLIAVAAADADALFEELKTTVPSAQRIGTVAEYQGGARIKLR